MATAARKWDNWCMSISRLRKSRGLPAGQAGYSIAAALVLIALLVLVAFAVQSTVPSVIVTSPASQGAQAASADAQVTDVAFKATQAQQQTVPVVAGKDQIAILITGAQPQAIYFP